jgi:hypothetical protein
MRSIVLLVLCESKESHRTDNQRTANWNQPSLAIFDLDRCEFAMEKKSVGSLAKLEGMQ